MKSGKRSYCKFCSRKYALKYYHKNYDKIASQRKERRMKDYGRGYHLKRTFGISLEDFDEMLKSQDGKCAICLKHHSEEGQAFAVDHDHSTGYIRGLLCRICNKNLLGKHNDRNIFMRAYNYLGQHTGRKVPEKDKS
jgi:hypothetical protein